MSSNWREWIRDPSTSLTTEKQTAFWKELLGDALIEKKEEEFKKRIADANLLGTTDPTERDKTLNLIHAEQQTYAAFANAVRKALYENFELILAADRTSSPRLFDTDQKIDELRKGFIESYNNALREYAIQIEVRKDPEQGKDDTQAIAKELLGAFQQTRENGLEHQKKLLATAKKNEEIALELYETEKTTKDKVAKLKDYGDAKTACVEQHSSFKQYCITKLLPTEFDKATEAAFKINIVDYKTKYKELNNLKAADNLQKIEEIEEAKLKETNSRWWAIWGALKNSKYFSLSCGTTMGGALIIIASTAGPIAMIAATFVAIPIVYIVTRADWWMTNRVAPELALELRHPIEFLKKYWAKLKSKPRTTIYNLFITSIVSAVWAALTYDTTLELTKQLYEKSTISAGLASSIVLGITVVAAAVASWKLYKSYLKNGKLRGLKTVWAVSLLAAVAGLGYWVLGAESVAFIKASVFAVTVMMTVYTVPTLYTIFDLYTDRFIKAFKGPIDKETGQDNEFHHANINKAYQGIVEDAKTSPEATEKFRKTYNVIMGIGLFISLGLSVMIHQTISGKTLSFTKLPHYENAAFWGSLVGSFAIVAAVVAGVCFAINTYADKNDVKKSKAGEINTAMLYKALLVLGGAALIGTYAIVAASEHMMGNIFTKWMHASSSEAQILNYVFTIGIGFLGAAGFYFGNAVRTVKNLFKTKSDSPDISDPTGKVRQPDFTHATYENKTRTGKTMHRVGDSLNWFGQDPTPKEAELTIYGNSLANSFQTIMSATSAAAAVVFSTSATVASGAASFGMNNFTQYPLPDAKRQEDKVRVLGHMRSNPA